MKTMKHIKHIIALLGLLLALSVPAQAVVSPFIRAGFDFSRLNAIDFVKDPNVKWQDKVKGWDIGYFGEAGVKLLGSHVIAGEIGYMKATSSVSGAGVTSREQVPVLVNYRMLFNVGPAAVFVGASAGIMSDKAGWREDVGNAATQDWKTFKAGNWIGLWGASAGVEFKLGKNWSVDLGARVLAVNAKDFSQDYLGTATNPETYKIGKNELYWRPNVRVALSLNW